MLLLTVKFTSIHRFLYIVCSGRVQTPLEGSRWMTSSGLFLCTPKAALGNGSSFVLTLKEQVSCLAGWSNLRNKRARARKYCALARVGARVGVLLGQAGVRQVLVSVR